MAEGTSYNIKRTKDQREAQITVNHQAFMDDLTLITRNRFQCQKAIDRLMEVLEWSRCLKLKPAKCQTFAMKVFTGEEADTSPSQGTAYSMFDPQLCLQGQKLAFIGKERCRLLGRHWDSTLSEEGNLTGLTDRLQKLLDRIDSLPLTGPMKIWIYNHYIIAQVTWPLLIYDFSLSSIQNLEKKVSVYLKKWSGLTKPANMAVLYLPKSKFGQGMVKLSTHFKKLQVGKAFDRKFSPDPSYQQLTDLKLQGQGGNRWNATKELCDNERRVTLEDIGGITATRRHGLGFDSKKLYSRMSQGEKKQRIKAVMEEIATEETERELVQSEVHGAMISWDRALPLDWDWRASIYGLSPTLLKFHLNAVSNSLPSPDNLHRWNMRSNRTCKLCGARSATLLHILNNCEFALNQGRYNWRHDKVLKEIDQLVSDTINSQNLKKEAALEKENQTSKSVRFVAAGKKPPASSSTLASLVSGANDWQVQFDYDNSTKHFPQEIATTNLRPDGVVWSSSKTRALIMELTVPMEENLDAARRRKMDKYTDLVDTCRAAGWEAILVTIEVGSRGFVGRSVLFLKRLGVTTKALKETRKKMSLAALQGSYDIWQHRENFVWHDKQPGSPKPAYQQPRETPKSQALDRESQSEEAGTGSPKTACQQPKETPASQSLDQEPKWEEAGTGSPKTAYQRSQPLASQPLDQEVQREETRTQQAHSDTPKPEPLIPQKDCMQVTKLPTRGVAVGLRNPSNQCYANSVMQLLLSSERITEAVQGSEGEFSRAVQNVVKNMQEATEGYTHLTPLMEVTRLQDRRWDGKTQQDAHEFLTMLLERLNEETSKDISILENSNQETVSAWTNFYLDNPSHITSLVTGQVTTSYSCRCGYKDWVQDQIRGVSIVPGSDIRQLDSTQADQPLKTCSACGVSVQGRCEWTRTPPELLLHVSRSLPDGKLTCSQPCPLVIKAKNDTYHLRAIVHHHGATTHSGHYTCVTKRGAWYLVDDTVCRRIDHPGTNSRTAYVLLYSMVGRRLSTQNLFNAGPGS